MTASIGSLSANRNSVSAESKQEFANQLDSASGVKIFQFPHGFIPSGSAAVVPYVTFMPYEHPRLTLSSIDYLNTIESLFAGTLDGIPAPKFAIALPIPTSALKTNYSVNYDQVDLGGTLGSIGTGLKSVVDKVVSTTDSTPGKLVEGGKVAFDAFLNTGKVGIYGAILGAVESISPGLATAGQKLNGVVENPFTETLFKNVGFRTHTFDYAFHPRNLEESKTIDTIIQLFKFYMHPASGEFLGSTAVNQFFSFPYEFKIAFSVEDTTFKLMPSVLESLSVSYGDGSTASFFSPVGNSARYPTKITLTLTFKEIVILTRDIIGIGEHKAITTDVPLTGRKRYHF